MTRRLSDRLWKRGLIPGMVKRSSDNMARSIVNMRGLESLPTHRDYVRRNPPERKGYAVRIAKSDIARMREADRRWRELGGYLP